MLDSSAAGGMLVRGGALRFGSYVGIVGLSVLSAALLTRHLGVARFGEYTTVMSLVAVVAAVTDAGMSNIGTREYAVLERRQRDLLMRELLGLRVTLTLIGVVLATGFAVAAGYGDALVLGTVAASVGTVAIVFQHTLAIPLNVDLRLGVVSVLDLLRQTLWVVGIVVLVELGAGVLPLLSLPLAANAALILPTALLVKGRISARLSLHRGAWRRLLADTVAFSLATAVGTIYVYTAQILTSLVANRYESGLFAVSFRVFIVAAAVPGLLVGTTLPLLSRAARDDEERLAYALQRIFEISLVGGVAVALVLSAGSHFIVSVIAGPRFSGASEVLAIQAFAMIASFVLAGWSFALLSLRDHRGLLLANAAALPVSVILTLILAGQDGARGAAIATVCGEAALAFGTLLALTRGRPRYRPSPAIVLKVAAAAVPAALLSMVPSMPSVVRLLVALAIYGAIILSVRALPSELKELLPAARRR